MKKGLLLTITLALQLTTLWSQTSLKGNILNESGNPLSGVVIQISPPYDSAVLAEVVTSEDGGFTMLVESENVYRITTSHPDYAPVDLPLLFIAYPGTKNIGDIYLGASETTLDELSGSIGVTGGFGWAEKVGIEASLQRSTSRISSYIQFSYRQNQTHQIWDVKQDLPFDNGFHHMEIRTIRRPVSANFRGRRGVTFRITSKSEIGLHFSGYRHRENVEAQADIIQDHESMAMMQSDQNTREQGIIGLELKHSWNENMYIRAEADLIRGRNEQFIQYHMREDSTQTAVSNQYYIPANMYVGQLVFHRGLASGIELESGIKVTSTNLRFAYTRLPEEVSQTMQFSEDIFSGYVQADYKIDSEFSMSLGVRYERANIKKHDPELPITTIHMDHFFPSISMAGRIGHNHRLAASYTQRIGRPSFNHLFVAPVFLSPVSCIVGNPDLVPSMNRISRLEYTFKEMAFSFQYNRMSDAIISYITDLDEDNNMLHYTVKNFDFLNIWEVSASLPLADTPWWDSQLMFTRNHYSMGSFKLNRNYLKLVNTLRLPSGFTMEVAANYQARSLFSVDRNDSFGTLDIGVSRSIGQKTLLNLSLTDIFASSRTFYQSADSETGFTSEFLQRPESRIISISLTWNLGQTKVTEFTPAGRKEMDRLRDYLVTN